MEAFEVDLVVQDNVRLVQLGQAVLSGAHQSEQAGAAAIHTIARNAAVKVYLDDGGDKRLVGRADVPDGHGPVYEVPLFGPASIIAERFALGTVTHLPAGGLSIVERVVLLGPGQMPELLPG